MQESLDYKVINKLMRLGRATWSELADHVGLSAPAAADRVRRLEERGVIQGYAALVDAAAVGYPLTAFVAVRLDRPKHRAPFLARVRATPEIAECHHVTGDDDYLLKVRCRSPQHLDEILTASIKGPREVVRTRTTIVLSTAKETVVLPLAAPGPVSSTSSGGGAGSPRKRDTRRASGSGSGSRGPRRGK
jgi:Lrp/AsnC family leucine-responsive transcriptional regulator